jgi:hypothetical protein
VRRHFIKPTLKLVGMNKYMELVSQRPLPQLFDRIYTFHYYSSYYHRRPIFQLDVIIIFSNGLLDKIVYMLQPLKCSELGREYFIYKLKNSVYGLCKSPRAWYAQIDDYLCHCGIR